MRYPISDYAKGAFVLGAIYFGLHGIAALGSQHQLDRCVKYRMSQAKDRTDTTAMNAEFACRREAYILAELEDR